MVDGRFCTKCGEFKPFSEFYKRTKAHKGDEYDCWCKECHRESKRKYLKENKSLLRQRHQEYYKRNSTKIKQKRKEYYEGNKDKVLKINKLYREQHRDSINAANKARRIKRGGCTEKEKQKNKWLRRIRKVLLTKDIKNLKKPEDIKKLTGMSPAQLKEYLLQTYKDRYGHLPATGDDFAIDHIIPTRTAQTVDELLLSFRYENLQLLTPYDNSKKR